MALLVILTIVFIYNFYLSSKIPNGLKDIHTITLIENIKNAIMYNSSADKFYLSSKEYFDNDGITKFQIRDKWMCLLSDPVIAKDIFLRTDIFPKLLFDEFLPDSVLSHHFGVNIVHSNGDIWKRARHICNLAFKVLPIHLFVDVGFKLMNIMETIDNKPIDVVDLMHRFALDVLGKTVFDFDFNNLGDPKNIYVTTYNEVQDEVNNFLFQILPLDLIPYFKNRRLGKVKKLQKLFDDFIKNKHKSMAARNSNGDLLELMIKACDDPNNEAFNDIELRYNLAIFMVAGHDTTANALATIFYLLAVHKNVQQKAREEILSVLGSDLTPSTEQHKALKYLNMIINENLRLYPPAPFLPFRKLAEDLKYKNHVIPAGTGISLFIYAMQRSPKLWENPEEFIPERFENEKNINGSYTWTPFGAGSRMCLGNHFSLIEQRIALCLILRKYEISLPSNSIHRNQLQLQAFGTPKPINLIFKRRTE
ncbi:cytochrome P450 [Gigaspora margarita]|uniref:Cytochrome P450 n=1 Tax=Gigaspora margarita TaxID=4874 RepID=A0A8H4A8Q6_GIGMA|nr:cytochrome P450 [Gigaspora margarita]